MNDQRSAISEQRNALERLIQRVPGFKGYYDRENRRQADAVLREHGVHQLDRAIASLQGRKRDAELSALEEMQRTLKQLETLRNELRHADQGYAGFFAEHKTDSTVALDAVYEFDEEIVERVGALVDAFESEEAVLGNFDEEVAALRRAVQDRKLKMQQLGS